MIYNKFKDLELSALGFGLMRLPLLEDGKTIDREKTAKMIDLALKSGVNYFDTAMPYHGGYSEVVAGEILNRYPRDSWYLASKFPGHQHWKTFDPKAIFEGQLKRCKVEKFDFYLFHNICETTIDDYMDPRWGILEYFKEQKKNGRITHLGLSTHASAAFLEELLDGPYGEVIEFCQIQLNYLDWDLQEAGRKVEILRAHGIPVWVMEPVRGGKLAKLSDSATATLRSMRPDETTAAWAFRFLQGIEGVTVTLSGMSDMAQMEDNLRTFAKKKPLGAAELDALAQIAREMHGTVPCTACRYCCDGCPAGLDIPKLISAYSDLSLEFNLTPMMYLEGLPDALKPSACLGCGACASICPQGIDIPKIMPDLAALYEKYPKWSTMCREREEAAKKLDKELNI